VNTFFIGLRTSTYVQRNKYQGETSRSWLIGYEWRPTKLPKKTTTFVTQKDWDDQQWALSHRYPISDVIRYKATPEQLRYVAAYLGYEEGKK
jgi:hypothetical protein